ncbi:restriction endonuclease subunit S, partial [Levilactobacillus zymae]
MSEKMTPNVRFKGFSDDWEQRKLGDAVNVVGGGTPKSSNPQFWDGEIEWFTPTEIGTTKYVSKSVRRISIDGLQHSSAKILPKNTILYTSRASIGDVAITKNKVTTNQGFQSWIPKSEETEFFYYLAQRIKGTALRLASGSTFKEISSSNIKGIKVVIPSQSIEKQKIGKMLGILDATIASNQKKVDQLKTLKKLFLQKIFDQEWRFRGFTDPWEQRKLKDISKYSNGGSFEKDVVSTGKYELITLKSVDIYGNLINSGKFIDKSVTTLKKGTLPELFTRNSKIPIKHMIQV